MINAWYEYALPCVLSVAGGIVTFMLFYAYQVKYKLDGQLRLLTTRLSEQEDRNERQKKIDKKKAKKNAMKRNSTRSSLSSSSRITSESKTKSPTMLKELALMNVKNTMGFTTDDWRILIHRLAPFLQTFTDHVEEYPTSTTKLPGFLYNSLETHMPEKPYPPEKTWDIFKDLIFTGMCFWQHPRFFGYFPINRSIPDTLAELLIGSLSIPMSDFDACPALADLEGAMVNWSGRALGLPEDLLYAGDHQTSRGGGFFLESASEAIFSAVMVARAKKIQEILLKEGTLPVGEHFLYSIHMRHRHEKIHEIAGKLVVYANREAHSSIDKGCNMAVLRHRPLNGDPTTAYGLTGAILETAVQEDLAAGLIPCMVHATVGTTSSCAYDKLDEIGEVCKKYNIWLHVDGAYGGSMWIVPSLRTTQKGIKYVDSIDVNLHKALVHSISTSLLWTKNQKAFREAFSILDPTKKQAKNGYDVANAGIHDSRRHRALKVWFVFRYFGLEGLRDHINRICENARYLEHLMTGHPQVRMFGTPAPGFFSWQYYEPGMTEEQINYYTSRFRVYLNETGEIYVTNSTVQGSEIIRMVVHYTKICHEDMDDTWERMKRHLEAFKENKDHPLLIRFPPVTPEKKMFSEESVDT